jgi:DNA topoisomerase-3
VKKSVTIQADMATVTCPKCRTGTLLKGRTAYGCSEYKSGCTFKVLFELYGKVLTEKQHYDLIVTGKSSKIKGLTIEGQSADAALRFDESFNVVIEG